MARPITGTIYKPDGAAWASGTVRARLMEPFETSTRVYPKTEITITLDANGQIPANTQLDTPGTGTAHYLITTPDQAHYEVYIATGPAVDLVTLLTIAGTAVDPDDLQTLMDAAAVFTITTVSSGPYTQLATDEYINTPSGTFTINLVTVVVGTTPPLVIDNTVGPGSITADAYGAETINGSATLVLGPGERRVFIPVANGEWRA